MFGREFPMVDVLVLWDALFADGPMLDLVDYIYISMLEAIRDRRTYLFPSTIFAVRSQQVSIFVSKRRVFLLSQKNPRPRVAFF